MQIPEHKWESRFDAALGIAASVILFLMMLLTFVDVVARYLFNWPLRGGFELTELMLLVLIFAGLPLVSHADEHVTMDFIDGKQVKEVLHENPVALSKEIGKKLGVLHAHNIIHADLTTSNMMFKDEVHFIDFGLSFVSQKPEDKAVDLHLLDRALESKHHEHYKICIDAALEGYKKVCVNSDEILKRLNLVKKRGRNKH